MAGIETFVVVSLAVALGYTVESVYLLAWPRTGPTAREKQTELVEQLAVGAVGTAATAGVLLASGGVPVKLLAPTFAAIEVFKGVKAAGKVADTRFTELREWADLRPSSETPKRKAVTTAAFGLTGALEALGVGLWAFVPAGFVLLYAAVRRFRAF
jgi:hypothetical protein